MIENNNYINMDYNHWYNKNKKTNQNKVKKAKTNKKKPSMYNPTDALSQNSNFYELKSAMETKSQIDKLTRKISESTRTSNNKCNF